MEEPDFFSKMEDKQNAIPPLLKAFSGIGTAQALDFLLIIKNHILDLFNKSMTANDLQCT